MCKVYLKVTLKSDKTGDEKIMKNKSCTGDICCSGAKIIRIPRGRQHMAPKMNRTLPEVGDVILYNEKLSEGMRIRGNNNLENAAAYISRPSRIHSYMARQKRLYQEKALKK